MRTRTIRLFSVLTALLLLAAAPGIRAVQTGQAQTGQAQVAPAQATPAERLMLVVGRSVPLDETFDIERIAITDPEVADVLVIRPRELLISGKKAGTVSLWIWGTPNVRVQYELVVDPGITTLQQRFQMLFPGEDIQVSVTQGALLLSGRVSSNEIMLRAAEIAQASSPEQRVINMLQLPGGTGSQQVMLQVRFAEVNSRAVRELGASLFATRNEFAARSTTQQFAAPTFNETEQDPLQGLVFSDLLNLFFLQRNVGIGAVVKALEQTGSFESLAEPNLIAYNGQEAHFLAGGEFPVVTSGANGNVNISFKDFGVKLRFKPTIAGDVIRLHVRPEVSELDFNNGITLSGFRIPALTTRYAETEVELRDGQSFAIAGLLDHTGQVDASAIPWLSRIPIIGHIFKSQAKRDERTELLVLITPRLVRPLNPDEVPPLPTIVKPPSGRGGGGGIGGQLMGGGGLVDAPPKPAAKPGRGGR